MKHTLTTCTVFYGTKRVGSGSLQDLSRQLQGLHDDHGQTSLRVFDDSTGELIDVDWREAIEDIPAPEESAKKPGRPKLGVVAREVTLLPRHWDWLGTQPGGASVALRKLVEQARAANREIDRLRQAKEATYRFALTMAGDEPGYEEAMRALFANDAERFRLMIAAWPADVREHAAKLAAFDSTGDQEP